MKKTVLSVIFAFCLILSGCSWMDGSYLSVTPHREQSTGNDHRVVSVSSYSELVKALENTIRSGSDSVVINTTDYSQARIRTDISTAIRYVRYSYPLGAYAVDSISYEIGTNASRPAIAVNITYVHSRIEIQRVRSVDTMDQAFSAIQEALDNCEPGIVLLVKDYEPADLTQLVADHAACSPHTVMETPQVSAAVYPESGVSRVIELTFSYENSRESLRQMQRQVEPVFASAALYVSGDGSASQKYSQLYAFLMERFDYEITTSITPAYSLLRHGVGDNRAFATVFAAMCRRAELDCQVVTGTKNGEPWNWNIILDDGVYYHVDLLRCSQIGRFLALTDKDMSGYVWDYSAYPPCGQPEQVPNIPPAEEPDETRAPLETEATWETEPTVATEETNPAN